MSNALNISSKTRSLHRIARNIGLLACVLMMCACAAIEPFHLAAGEPAARVETTFDEGLLICIDGKVSPMRKIAGYYEVPAGKLVTLYSRRVLTRFLNSVNYCESSISVVPKAETNYLLNLKVRYLSCEFELLELDKQGKMVAVLDPAEVHLPCFYDDYFRSNFGDEFVD